MIQAKRKKMTMMRRLLARYAPWEFIAVRYSLTLYQVREGFIIDDEDEEPEERERRRRKDKKRRRAEREEEEAVLDEEDLDLIGEANPEWERKTAAQVNQIEMQWIKFDLTRPLAKAQAP
jgi:hypothetical protein